MPLIAQLVQAYEGTNREVIHRFNEIGLACPGPQSGEPFPPLNYRLAAQFLVAVTGTMADRYSPQLITERSGRWRTAFPPGRRNAPPRSSPRRERSSTTTTVSGCTRRGAGQSVFRGRRGGAVETVARSA